MVIKIDLVIGLMTYGVIVFVNDLSCGLLSHCYIDCLIVTIFAETRQKTRLVNWLFYFMFFCVQLNYKLKRRRDENYIYEFCEPKRGLW